MKSLSGRFCSEAVFRRNRISEPWMGPLDAADTDAWFVAFAPYGKPTVAVSVMLVGQGAGGDTAAPAAGAVLKAALS